MVILGEDNVWRDTLEGAADALTLAELAELLRKLRRRHARERGDTPLTYRELAAKTGWAHGVIGDYFAGKTLPPTDRFDILVRMLGASPAEQGALATARDRVEESRRRPRQDTSRTVLPRELPGDVPMFTGREVQLAELDLLLSRTDATMISAVSGTAGVGKTALAVRWAHRVKDRFPDGQLYVDLRGYGPGTPLRPIEVLVRFLVALGVPPAQITSDEDTAAAMYRSQLAGRRMLMLLDNANHPDQVRPLLPSSCGCLVLVTSRDQLAGLVAKDGASRLALDTFTPSETQQLLTRLLGSERAQREPEALTRLAALCGYLPLALRIAAANLIVEPGTTITEYAARLASNDRLSVLQTDGDPLTAVRVAFDHSYATLPADAQRLLRLLGLVPGPHVTARTAAAVANIPATQAAQLLDRLTGAYLVDEHTPGRYSFHDLLRAYAAHRAAISESAPDRRAALSRLHDYYLHGVDAAAGQLYPHVLRLPAPREATPPLIRFDDHGLASAWLDAERPNLVAAVVHAGEQGLTTAAWRLADALRGYLYLRMHTVDWIEVTQAGLAAAEADGDPQAQACAYANLATLHWAQGRHHEAISHYTTTLNLARRAGWVDGESAALGNLGNLSWALGRLDTAAEHYAQVLDLYRQTGQVASQATALGNLGLVYFGQGRLDLAAAHCRQALTLHRETGSRSGEARTLTHLGDVYLAMGHHHNALTALTDALTLLRQIGDRNTEGDTIRTLAALHRDTNHTRQALELAGTVVEIARDTGDRRLESGALTTLASIYHRLGRYQTAIEGHRQALDIARDIGNRYLETEALIGLAAAFDQAGDRDEAANLAATAATMARNGGYRLLETRARADLAHFS